jgi:N6-L-threonylcarbamoyladenine synthase
MLIMGIETSCDETSVAVLRDGKEVLSNTIISQIKEHEIFGGVVPEIASRSHLESINQVIDISLKEASVSLSEIQAIAVTNRPGLIGSLLVGVSTAKALSYSLDIPLIPINHLEAHISAIFIDSENHAVFAEKKQPEYPFMSLLVSGGHTAVYLVEDETTFKLLASTRDDAAGETLDKAGKLLGLPYPGGVYLDKLSQGGDVNAVEFPRPLPNKSIIEFSLSGLKNAMRVFLEKNNEADSKISEKDIAASFQEKVIDHLLEKTKLALKKHGQNQLVLCGGVAANSRLRKKLEELNQNEGLQVWIPDRKLCTDNGAMIAGMGHKAFSKSSKLPIESLNLNAFDHAQ